LPNHVAARLRTLARPFEAGILAAIGGLTPMPSTTNLEDGSLQTCFLQGYASNLELCANLYFQPAPPRTPSHWKGGQPVQTYGSNPANLWV